MSSGGSLRGAARCEGVEAGSAKATVRCLRAAADGGVGVCGAGGGGVVVGGAEVSGGGVRRRGGEVGGGEEAEGAEAVFQGADEYVEGGGERAVLETWGGAGAGEATAVDADHD